MSNVITGTGDGGGMFGQSRKIKSFLWLVLAVAFIMYVASKIMTPVEIANQALWIVGLGGLFTIGGQSLVDVAAKAADGYAASKIGKSSEKTTIVETEKSA